MENPKTMANYLRQNKMREINESRDQKSASRNLICPHCKSKNTVPRGDCRQCNNCGRMYEHGIINK